MKTGHNIAMGLRAAYLSMHRQTNFRLAPFGMTADQFVLLALLSEQDGITQQQLAHLAGDAREAVAHQLELDGPGTVAPGRQTGGGGLRRLEANADVTAELHDIARSWVRDAGIDGYRLDASKGTSTAAPSS